MRLSRLFLMLFLLVLFAFPVFAQETAQGAVEVDPAPADILTSIEDHDTDAFRSVSWTLTQQETADLEQVEPKKDTVVVADQLTLYTLEATKLVYQFEADRMMSRTYTIKKNNADSFASLFLSLCMRYGVPMRAEDREGLWVSGAVTVELKRGKTLTATYWLDWPTIDRVVVP